MAIYTNEFDLNQVEINDATLHNREALKYISQIRGGTNLWVDNVKRDLEAIIAVLTTGDIVIRDENSWSNPIYVLPVENPNKGLVKPHIVPADPNGEWEEYVETTIQPDTVYKIVTCLSDGYIPHEFKVDKKGNVEVLSTFVLRGMKKD